MSKFRIIDNSAVFKQVLDEDECLAEGRPARFIVAAVKQMDLSAFEDMYRISHSQFEPTPWPWRATPGTEWEHPP